MPLHRLCPFSTRTTLKIQSPRTIQNLGLPRRSRVTAGDTWCRDRATLCLRKAVGALRNIGVPSVCGGWSEEPSALCFPSVYTPTEDEWSDFVNLRWFPSTYCSILHQRCVHV